MEFQDNKAIYLQIVDFVGEQILLGKWAPGNKILSIRDLAVSLQVTPNTIQRSYDTLQERGVIANKRGIGYFVEDEAVACILDYKRREFIGNDLPVLFKNMYLLKMDMQEVEVLFREYLKANFKR
jgi:GntR family transcriptional regulator